MGSLRSALVASLAEKASRERTESVMAVVLVMIPEVVDGGWKQPIMACCHR
jgi:hypothetical protein